MTQSSEPRAFHFPGFRGWLVRSPIAVVDAAGIAIRSPGAPLVIAWENIAEIFIERMFTQTAMYIGANDQDAVFASHGAIRQQTMNRGAIARLNKKMPYGDRPPFQIYAELPILNDIADEIERRSNIVVRRLPSR